MDSLQSAPQRPEHTRSKSAFSFRSQKSSGSGEKLKVDLTETEKERRKNKFSGKGFHNPNRALQEAEPAARALELTTIASLGGGQHKDWQGKVITDPDSSNPARSRLERPLDTIRSFEAAAEGSRKKQQAARAESSLGFIGDSRRSSVVGTEINIHPRSPAAIPGAQMMPRRVPSYQRDPSYDPYARAPPSGFSRRGIGPRMSSAPSQMDRSYNQGQNGYNNYNGQSGQNVYNAHPYHGYNDSFDTNGDSTGSPSEPWTNSTDPSSENSSIDRIHAVNKQADATGDAYGGAYQNGPGYANGAVQHDRSSPMHAPPMRQRQPIAEESWNEDRGLEGAYNYQGAPHQPGRPYQQQRPVSNMEGGMSGGAPPASYMPQQQQQSQRGPQPNVTSPGAGKPFARKVMPLGGENRPNPAAVPNQQYNQAQAQTSRPKTLRKESSEKRSSEKPKSWLKRRFSRG